MYFLKYLIIDFMDLHFYNIMTYKFYFIAEFKIYIPPEGYFKKSKKTNIN